MNTQKEDSVLISMTQYHQLLSAALAMQVPLFPGELGAALVVIINTHLTDTEAKVFWCHHQGMANDVGLAHLCALHGERKGPDGNMYPYMTLSTYKRKLSSAYENISKHLPNNLK